MPIHFGTDGWRAVISDTFTFHNLRLVCQAIADAVKDPDVEPFVLTVDRTGQLFINEEKQPSVSEEVVRKAAVVNKRNPKTPFLVKGDKLVEYQAVMSAMVLLKQAGIPKVGLVTEPPEK